MTKLEVKFRILIHNPVAGVLHGLQTGRATVVAHQLSSGADLTFEWTMPAQTDGEGSRFTGPFAQGPPAARFVYVCAGTCAGQTGSPWTRRMKVPLTPIPWALAGAGRILCADFEGRGRDGGPWGGTVKLLRGWRTECA